VDARNLQANVVLDDAPMMSLPDLEMRYAGRRINRMMMSTKDARIARGGIPALDVCDYILQYILMACND
jgi:hypothetical protein